MDKSVKCNMCDSRAIYDVANPSGADQQFCDLHLPWFINKRTLPDNVSYLIDEPLDWPEDKLEELRELRKQDASGTNNNETSTSSPKPSAPSTGSVSTGSTGSAKNNKGVSKTG